MPLFRKSKPQSTIPPAQSSSPHTGFAVGSPARQPLFGRARDGLASGGIAGNGYDSTPTGRRGRAATSVGGMPAGGGGNSFDASPVWRNPIFLIGFILGVVGWWTAFISMCVAESKLGSFVAGPYCGTLWFAIIFQAAILIHLFLAIAYDNLPLHRFQLAFVIAVVVTFAINGVQYIYAGQSLTIGSGASQGVGAGWLLLALVDLLWLLYITSEENTFLYRAFDSLGDGGLTPPSQHWSSSNGYAGASRGGNDREPSFPNTAAGGDEYGLVGGGRVANMNGASHGVGNDEMTRNLSANGGPMGYGGQANGPMGGGRVGPLAGGDLGAPIGGATGAAGGIPRAKALYAYTASPDDPNEVSFAKGEVIDVIESTGKWWQCRTASGQTGIAPSNYLQLL